MKAAIYARVSTDEQAESGTSLDSQQEKTRAYIEAKGWTLADEHVYVDQVSGAKESRPALDRLKRACERHEVEVIVVTKHDRLARSLLNALLLMRDLDAIGVTVEFTDEPNESELIRNIRFSIAEDERKRITERTATGRRAKARQGVWVGGSPPFGYCVVDKRLAVDEDEADTIRRAVALLLSNSYAVQEVARVLNAEGRLPRQDNPRWTPRGREIGWNGQKLRYALTREVLTGRHVYGKGTDEEIETVCPAILSRQEWDVVQATLAKTKRQVYSKPRVYPLSLRLISPCGLAYTGIYDADAGRRFYRCQGKESPPYCSCCRVDAKTIEDAVWEEVLGFLEDPEQLLELTGLNREDTDEVHDERLRALDAKVANLSEALTARVADALEAGMSPTLIAAAVSRLEAERDELVERRDTLGRVEELRRDRERRRTRLSRLSRASLKLVNATLEEKKTLLAILDTRVVMTQDGLQITGIFTETLAASLPVVDHATTYRSCEDYGSEHAFALVAVLPR